MAKLTVENDSQNPHSVGILFEESISDIFQNYKDLSNGKSRTSDFDKPKFLIIKSSKNDRLDVEVKNTWVKIERVEFRLGSANYETIFYLGYSLGNSSDSGSPIISPNPHIMVRRPPTIVSPKE
ncbi:MAG: hypothetical protein LAT67_10310 [Balneolales bacterium]|nr:hypothetical protein [Balneolales bacterium]